MNKHSIKVIALDLEGTLISNAISQIPRPGLYNFLKQLKILFPRVVIFTAIEEVRFRKIAQILVAEAFAPHWFINIEYIIWWGKIKDLAFIPNALVSQILLLDDIEEYIHPDQKNQWILVPRFDYSCPEKDNYLEKILLKLKQY